MNTRNRNEEPAPFGEGGAPLVLGPRAPWRRPAFVNDSDERLEGTVRSETGTAMPGRGAIVLPPRNEPDGGVPRALAERGIQRGRRRTRIRRTSRESGISLPSIATRGRIQHKPGCNRAMEEGPVRFSRQRDAELRARGLATRADAGFRKRIQPRIKKTRR